MSAEHRYLPETLGGRVTTLTGMVPPTVFLTGGATFLSPQDTDSTLYTVLDDWIFDADPIIGGSNVKIFYNHYFLNQSPHG